ncbi:hypothetical protein IMSHALPRED_003430 [Imshaugia aleurites]|uniref:Uncharacterized protein n=1 Tax=Imshaugia aleurites TaxID=172621 RepID=A0A8H3J838_9LECA|nr:hypothetical protein IMSHALPRED_003430 [Imshaugia aleurites]
MAQSDVSPCLSDGETKDRLQKRQRVFAATLPFKGHYVPQNLVELAIDQTRKRWAWFAESRKLDTERGTELGTLGYLPWEICQQMFKALLSRLRRSGYGLGIVTRAPEILDSGFCITKEGLEPLSFRLSSPTLRLEFDICFFFNTIIKFERSADLRQFFCQSPDCYDTKVRCIIIRIWVPCGCTRTRRFVEWRDGWTTACSQIPASLQSVSFGLDLSRPDDHSRNCWTHGSTRRLVEIKRAASLIEVLSKMIVRAAPGAAIEMHDNTKKELLPEYLELLVAAINDVER